MACRMTRVQSHGELQALRDTRKHRRLNSDSIPRSDPIHYTPEPHSSPPRMLPRIESGADSLDTPLDRNGSDDDEESQQQSRDRLNRLLSLLDVFCRLKESTGVERATLTSMLTLDESTAALLVGDVVVEVENQRRQLEELRHLPSGPIRNLVQELIKHSPEMRQVQNLVLSGLSLSGLKALHDSQRLWDVMTVYIDKLHSLELLIVEEMENCLPATTAKSSQVPTDVLASLMSNGFAGTVPEDLRKALESMSGEEIKARLLEALPEKTSEPPPVADPVSKKGVEDLLEELRLAPASKEWEIDIYELRFLKRIGQGSAGTTYIADWGGLEVACKVASISEMGLEGWRTEVQSLQKLHHPNIIRLLGSVYHPSPLTFGLVLEYCDAGDLSLALEKPTPSNFFFHVALSIAKGLTYLHHRSIIHRDIKPSNVLLHGDLNSGNYSVKVTDFGVATDLNSGNRTAETGTYRWMAPEVIRHEVYSQTADVYSYAIVLWQLLTREEPFQDKSQLEAAVAVSMESARPPLPSDTPGLLISLLERCWCDDPTVRPSFESIVAELVEIEKDLGDEQRRWLEMPLGHAVYKKKKYKPAKPTVALDTDHIPTRQQQHQKKGKGLRAMFNRKSTHF